MKKILFDRSFLLLVCIIWSAMSFYISVYSLKESNLSLFSSSGAVMNMAGLLLTIKHNLAVLWTIPKEWGVRVVKHGAGSFFGTENTPEDYQNYENVKKDETYGITLILIGTFIWAYSSYMPIKWVSALLHN